MTQRPIIIMSLCRLIASCPLTTILPDRTTVVTAVIHSGHLATSLELAILTIILPDRTTVVTAVIHSGHLTTPLELAMLTTSYLTEPW